MKYVLIPFLFLFPLSSIAQTGTSYQQLFWQQIATSCRPDVTWRKSVYDLKGDSPDTPQTKEYKLDCSSEIFIPLGDDTGPLPSTDEFDFLFEYQASNRYIIDYFDIMEDEEGFLAVIRKDHVEDTPLQHQEFKLDEKGKLRFAKSVILKDNMLYSMKVTIEVHFDEQGRYEKHRIETETDPIAQDGIHTMIIGAINQ